MTRCLCLGHVAATAQPLAHSGQRRAQDLHLAPTARARAVALSGAALCAGLHCQVTWRIGAPTPYSPQPDSRDEGWMVQPRSRRWTRRRTMLLAALLLLAAAGTAAALWVIGVRRGSTSSASACRSAPPSTAPKPSEALTPRPTAQPSPQPPPLAAARHYEHVFPDGGMDVYDADANWNGCGSSGVRPAPCVTWGFVPHLIV